VVQDIEKEQQRLKVHIFNLKVGRRTSPWVTGKNSGRHRKSKRTTSGIWYLMAIYSRVGITHYYFLKN
jgi:hypothetical protein